MTMWRVCLEGIRVSRKLPEAGGGKSRSAEVTNSYLVKLRSDAKVWDNHRKNLLHALLLPFSWQK